MLPCLTVDYILEKIKTRHTQELTDHLNTMDNTGKPQFTQEEERTKKTEETDDKSKDVTSIPYIWRITEALQGIMKKHHINTQISVSS